MPLPLNPSWRQVGTEAVAQNSSDETGTIFSQRKGDQDEVENIQQGNTQGENIEQALQRSNEALLLFFIRFYLI